MLNVLFLIPYLALLVATIMVIPFVEVKWKGIVTLVSVILSAILSTCIGVQTLLGDSIEFVFSGSPVTGEIPLRIDALSGWFILLINFTFVTGGLYGLQYMKDHRRQTANISLHCSVFLLCQASLTAICVIQNSIVFLVIWEIMTLSTFMLIVFEHQKQETIKAATNFLIQSHVCIVMLYVGFIWVITKTSSYDFNAISEFSESTSPGVALVLFLCFFIGFSIKAGFVPFHTWLPYAHPAAPSHISGVMSGVIIKIGIFGMLRMLLLIQTDFTVLGSIILIFSVISGVYGVMLAILQHNLKKLLAYHSIENIGIIGIGIGIGTIGMGTNNSLLILLGFGGGILHVLNHSLFKSLLFYAAGNIYQATHTMNIEHLGGLIKKMPQTAILFLIASLAICGLPPFNGFVSEFLIYSGLFKNIENSVLIQLLITLFSVLGLVLIGGLAMLCFTKAFGIVFLGNSRHQVISTPVEANAGKLIPMYMIVFLIIAIGIFPDVFFRLLSAPIQLFSNKIYPGPTLDAIDLQSINTIEYIGWCSLGFIVLVGLIFLIRSKITHTKIAITQPTWGCGYTGDTQKMQYSASSFIRTYRKLAEPILGVHKKKREVKGIFPRFGSHEIHSFDKIEKLLISKPLNQIRYFFDRFGFLQNGNPQIYVLYGVVFITLILCVPFIYDIVIKVVEFINQI